MRYISHQQGVGLVEVLVAVLLLSVAVLGFSALQMRAIKATDESLIRTKSMTVVRNLAEAMRAYPEAYINDDFKSVPLTAEKAVPTIQAVMSSSATTTVTIDGKPISILATANNCLSTEVITDPTNANKKIPKQPCNINQLAARDALMVKKIASEEGLKVAIVTCPGTTEQAIQQQMCVITAWSDTKAILSDSDTAACATANGVYKIGSHCLISEAY